MFCSLLASVLASSTAATCSLMQSIHDAAHCHTALAGVLIACGNQPVKTLDDMSKHALAIL